MLDHDISHFPKDFRRFRYLCCWSWGMDNTTRMEDEELERIARNERQWEIHGSQKRKMNAYDRMPGSQKRRIEREEAALSPGHTMSPTGDVMPAESSPDDLTGPHADTCGTRPDGIVHG